MQHKKEEIDAAFDKAPGIIREALFSKETSDTVRKIGDKHNLHIDKIGQLAGEIGFVILGLEPSSAFVSNIQGRLGIDQATAQQIGSDVNNDIFLKIRESLKQLEENKNTPKPEELLREIDQRAPLATADEERKSILDRKLTENFLTGSPDTPTTPSATPIKKIDPYLEPLE